MHRRCVQFGVLVSILGLVNGFNLSPNYAQVFEDPRNQTGSYFGFSIGLQRYNANRPSLFWMVVGAPKANSTTAAHTNINEPGVVYRCTTNAGNSGCQPVVLDAGGNEKHSASYLSYIDRKDHSMTGATLDVTNNGGLLVCAPKWINSLYDNEYLVNGICYWKASTGSNSNALKLMPLINKNDQGISTPNDEDGQSQNGPSIRRFYYSYGEAGISAHITPDGKEMLLGAPGILDWIGSVIWCREQVQDFNVPSSRRRRQVQNFTDFKFDIPNPYDAKKIHNSGYFGYAVNSGYFLRPNKLLFVASAPREAALHGSVSIYEYTTPIGIKVHISLEGTQLGEYFGASVCVVDLNNDQLDDLVVGAPLHSLLIAQGSRLAVGDEGRVYVFINEGKGIMTEIGDTNKIMGMQIPGARFGTSVSSIGDLNKDGFNDFAVGAPYDNDGRGAIYIYHGHHSGVNPKYSQRITAQEIHPSLSGFGYSISRGVDIDNNNYNDLAVGAFSSGHAVLIRSRPVIKFFSTIGNNVKEISINASEFAVDACLRYQGRNVPPTADVQIFVSVISETEVQAFIKSETGTEPISSTYRFYTTLQFNKNTCKTFKVTLVKVIALNEDNIDYTKPFELKMSYLIDERKIKPPKLPNTDHKGDTFCNNCPVVDPNEVSATTKYVHYATGCKTLICQPDLAVSASFEDGVRSPYKIGTRSNVWMKILVDNTGETAFLAKLNVKIPRWTPLVRIPSRCQDSDEGDSIRLECDIGNPLRSNSQARIDLELSFKDLSSSLESLSYQFHTTSSGSDQHPENNTRVLTLGLEAEADMEIVGVSTQNELVYLPENTQSFSHKYEVINYGPSPALAVRLEFGIPVAHVSDGRVISFLEVYEPVVKLNSQAFSCKPKRLEFSKRKGKSISENEDLIPRRKRSAQLGVDSWPKESEKSLNTTYLLNCLDPAIECMTVVCDPVGPFLGVPSRALVTFEMRANLTKLASVLNMKDTIVVSSWGVVSISPSSREKQPVGVNARTDNTVVSTLFYGTIQEEALAIWIWIVAILGGILLLLIITGILYKTGFFRRKEKEDLDELKDNDNLQLASMNSEGCLPENEIKNVEDERL